MSDAGSDVYQSLPKSEWIAVCGEEGANPIEVETEEDGTLLLEGLTALFPGTTTLKYRNKDSNAYRSVKCSKGVLKAPGGSWDQAPIYICVNPTKAEATGASVAAPAPSNPKKRTHAQAGMDEPTGQAGETDVGQLRSPLEKKDEEKKDEENKLRGFARGLTAERIIEAVPGEPREPYLYLPTYSFLIKWKGNDEEELVPAEEVNFKIPQMVIKFYERKMRMARQYLVANQ